MGEKGYRRRRFYIHEIQKEYAILIVILLLVYTFILSLFLFGPPAIKLFVNAPLTEKSEAATQVLVFAERLWPAVIVSLILSTLISIYVTHKVAGPIYRFEQTIKKLILGDISVRVKLRENDRLVYLSKLINEMVESIEVSIRDIKGEADEIRKILDSLVSEMKSAGTEDMLRLAEDIAGHRDRIDAALAKFRTSSFKESQ